MGRTKGLPKTGGRVKGSANKSTQTTRDWVQALIDDNRQRLEKDLSQLEPRERWQVIEKLLQYTTPKMQSVEAQVDLNNLSDEQLNAIVSEITKGVGDE
ncbi:MAG: hypothetical protein LBC84_06765 [Prevotellaceae bacterium]|jgi:hypothetical protein|nr:hypothetical protein [Prevotellaceae bacterium]